MITVKDVILQSNFESVSKEIKVHYGGEHLQKIKDVYAKLRNMPYKNNSNKMIIFIRVLKENNQRVKITVKIVEDELTYWYIGGNI